MSMLRGVCPREQRISASLLEEHHTHERRRIVQRPDSGSELSRVMAEQDVLAHIRLERQMRKLRFCKVSAGHKERSRVVDQNGDETYTFIPAFNGKPEDVDEFLVGV